MPAIKPARNAVTKATEGSHRVRHGAPLKRTSQQSWAAARPAMSAAALYFVDAARPPTNPEIANHLLAACATVGVAVERSQQQRERSGRQHGHQDVGHREVGIPDVKDRHAKEERGQQPNRRAAHPPRQ